MISDTSAGAPGAYFPKTPPLKSGDAPDDGPDDGAVSSASEGAELPDGAVSSASDGADFPVPPHLTAFLQEPDTFWHQRPSKAAILEMSQ